MGAALAYYTVFSMAPLLLVAIAIAGLVFGRQAAEGQIVQQIGGVVGTKSAEAVQALVQNAWKPATGVIATIIGIVTLLFGATGVFGELQDALDRIWKGKKQSNRPIIGLLKDRFVSFTMVLGVGFLLLVSLILSAGLSAVSTFLSGKFLGAAYALQVLNTLVSFVVSTLLFGMMYKILPDLPVQWRDVWLGAIITSLFFAIGKYFIGLYLGTSSISSTFGAAGSLVVILVWVYCSAQIFLFGAEFTQVYSQNRKEKQEKVTAAVV